jgi:digalactosyldiacylglycerol synthase
MTAEQGPGFDVAVVTSAAPPWLTGPAYLALNQAAGLRRLGYRVAFVVPWVTPRAQAWLWGAPTYDSPRNHARAIAAEAQALTGSPAPDILHYRGHLSRWLRGIVPLQDVFAALPPARAIIMVEPEHLCWFPLTRSRRKGAARTVVGVVMTNYGFYIRRAGPPGAGLVARLVDRLHRHLIRVHVDRVVPVSPAVAALTDGHPGCVPARVTGVLASYAEVPPVTAETTGVYFLGRLVWDKGLAEVIEVARRTGIVIDILGDGPDGAAIRAHAKALGAPVRFLGAEPRPWTRLAPYRVFLNPSRSEVLCTATAEALVAGRHVVLADCPANEPFAAYPNVLAFHGQDGAVTALRQALDTLPAPPDAARRGFDWTLACRRLAALSGLAAVAPSTVTPGPADL